MKKTLLTVALMAFAAFATTASAEQLLFTKSNAKGGASSVAIDYVSDGQSVGVQIEILVPGKAQVDLSRFAKDLPKGFVFEHGLVDGKLILTVVNDNGVTFPKGIVSLGTIRSIGGSGELVLDRLESVNANGQILNVETVQ
jgi:hypothetical protein